MLSKKEEAERYFIVKDYIIPALKKHGIDARFIPIQNPNTTNFFLMRMSDRKGIAFSKEIVEKSLDFVYTLIELFEKPTFEAPHA